MNILIDKLPTHVNVEGKSYEINTNFRNSILFEMLIQDNTVSSEEKLTTALEIYYTKEIPKDLNKAIDKILWFYRGGKDIESTKNISKNNTQNDDDKDISNDEDDRNDKSSNEQVYSFEHDDEYIFAAFLDQYNIDLENIEYLHWWKFKSMFKSLKEDNEIVKIIGYRSMKISPSMSKEEKEYYRKMKKIHELPSAKYEDEKVTLITDILLNGGDLSSIK